MYVIDDRRCPGSSEKAFSPMLEEKAENLHLPVVYNVRVNGFRLL